MPRDARPRERPPARRGRLDRAAGVRGRAVRAVDGADALAAHGRAGPDDALQVDADADERRHDPRPQPLPGQGRLRGVGAYLAELEHSVRAHREAGLRTAFAPYWRDRATFTYDDDGASRQPCRTTCRREVRRLTGTPISNRDLYRCRHGALAAAGRRPADRRPALDRRAAVGVGRPARCRWGGIGRAGASDPHARAREPPPAEWGDVAHGGRELSHLAERGVLGERTTIAHGVYLRDADIDLMAERRAMVAHNCSSNLRLACGIAPVRRLVARGVTVGLGFDDMAVDDDEDMLAEVRMAHVAQRIWEGPEPPLGARDMLRLCGRGAPASPASRERWKARAGLPRRRGGPRPGRGQGRLHLIAAGLRGPRGRERPAAGTCARSWSAGRVLVRDGAPVHVDMDALGRELADGRPGGRGGRPGPQAFLERLRPGRSATRRRTEGGSKRARTHRRDDRGPPADR